MKFSYPLIKKLVPGLKNKAQVIDALTMHAFETEEAGKNALEVGVNPNRWSDAASHMGIAREAAAALGLKFKVPPVRDALRKFPDRPTTFSVAVQDKKLCPRYTAAAFENIKLGPSPKWMQEALTDCGLRPISNVVDIMNYVMLEIGQPMHAFDAEKLDGEKIVVRQAKKGERITTIDGQVVALDSSMLVIADGLRPVAIAGIKGGHGPEVTNKTKRIIVESANFDSKSVYTTSKSLGLTTDASLRFAHSLSPELAGLGLARAAELLMDITGAKIVGRFDSEMKHRSRRVLKFDRARFEKLIGVPVTATRADDILERLGFVALGKEEWEIPAVRTDIETHEDLAEEVARLLGYDALPSRPPHVALHSSESDESVVLKEKSRNVLAGLGQDEIYTNSFISEETAKLFSKPALVVGLENSLSAEFSSLRPSLVPGLGAALAGNARFVKDAGFFEIGNVFVNAGGKPTERTMLGIARGASPAGGAVSFLRLKGTVLEFLKGMGVEDAAAVIRPRGKEPERLEASRRTFCDPAHTLAIEADGAVFGYIGMLSPALFAAAGSVCELDLGALLPLMDEESGYVPLSKFPAVMRDISLLIPPGTRIGDLIEEVSLANRGLIADADLVDEYADPSWKGKQSVTLRMVFQANDRTLTAAEVDGEMKKIAAILAKRFEAEIR